MRSRLDGDRRGDTGDDVDRDVNHHGVPDPVAHGHTHIHPIAHGGSRPVADAHTYCDGDQYAFRHFQVRGACEFPESGSR